MNENQIADIWILFKEYLDRKIMDTVAERYIELLTDHSVSDKQLEESLGFDHTLDSAITYYLGNDSNGDLDFNEEEEDFESWEDD